jgi:ClpP class serine protease
MASPAAGDLFWLIFLGMAAQPLIRQKLLDAARIRTLEKLEKARGSRVVMLVHRQETMAFFGFPVLRFITIEDSEQVVRALRMTAPRMPIDLVLHTPGGMQLAALQIAHAMRHREGKVSVIVPHYAMSGGTLIALAADEILMDQHAVLGPIDPQINNLPAASIIEATEQKKRGEIDDQTLIWADVARKALHQTEAAVESILARRVPRDKAQALAKGLTQGRWTHDYPITCDEAVSLGLPVKCSVPKEVYELMSLFPQPVRHAAVEYIPRVYRPAAPPQTARQK